MSKKIQQQKAEQLISVWVCYTEKDLIECQKHFIKQGYYWYSKFTYGDKIQYYEDKDFKDRKMPDKYEPLMILLKTDKCFGWMTCEGFDDKNIYHNKVTSIAKTWNSREDKLKRILK